MGIKFQCPQGHKLNVKAFLAGKRGICPHCGVKFTIPTESGGVAAEAKGKSPEAEVTADVQFSDPQQAAEVAAPQMAPIVSAQAAAPAVPVSAPALPVSAPANFAAAPATADPLSEAPDAVWYVRPRSGGQFGPAPAETMRKWIGEGRVAADSLVWRDGWPDWKDASAVLPQLGAGGPASHPAPSPVAAAAVAPASPVGGTQPAGAAFPSAEPTAVSPGRAANYRHVSRRKSQQTTATIVVLLAILAVVLMIVFAVIVSQDKPAESSGLVPASGAATHAIPYRT